MMSYHIVGEWLVEDVPGCTCGGSGLVSPSHQPACGAEPIAKVEDLLSAVQQNAELRGEVERLRAEASENCTGCERPTNSVDTFCFVCKLDELETTGDDLRAQLAAAQAQLARLLRIFDGINDAIHNETLTEFSRLVAVSVLKNAALSAAPQPEPERCPCATPGGALYLDNLRRLSPSRRTIAAAEAACTCGQHRLTWPEPPASDEPTGRSD